MNLLPRNIAKQSSREAARIECGAVVEYEHSAKALLGLALTEKSGKWRLLNQSGHEVELPADRIYLLPAKLELDQNKQSQHLAYLEKLSAEATILAAKLQLAEVWDLVIGERSELSCQELTELLCLKDDALSRLATRRALHADSIYFKRRKNGYEPRAREVVEELRRGAELAAEKERERQHFKKLLLDYAHDKTVKLPPAIRQLEELAALGNQAQQAKELLQLVEEVAVALGCTLSGRTEEKAFALLVAIGHFSVDENLAFYRLRRAKVFSAEVEEEATAIAARLPEFLLERSRFSSRFLVSIDAQSTRDIDDALSCEELDDGYLFGVHISDASSCVSPRSFLEAEALQRASSIYCPDQQVPMLPQVLSEQTLSLVEQCERPTISYLVETDRHFRIRRRRIERTRLSVLRRLSYEEVDTVLYGKAEKEHSLSAEEEGQLLLLWHFAMQCDADRLASGAVNYPRHEMTPRVLEDGRIILEDQSEESPGRKLVSEMMVLANHSAALFASENKIPLIFRSQEVSDLEISSVGLDIPEGPARDFAQRGYLKRSLNSTNALPHSGLGLTVYTQVTSPIRRAIDLLNERQLAHFLCYGEGFYSAQELQELLVGIQNGVDEAFAIQREGNRYWLLRYFQQEKTRELDAVVLRTEGLKPLLLLDQTFSIHPFHPAGQRGDGSLRAGARIRVALERIDPRKDLLTLREIS